MDGFIFMHQPLLLLFALLLMSSATYSVPQGILQKTGINAIWTESKVVWKSASSIASNKLALFMQKQFLLSNKTADDCNLLCCLIENLT